MIKAYTDLEQSKKLAEILPIESADMSWVSNGLGKPFTRTIPIKGDPEELCACWSLAALLEQLDDSITDDNGNDWQLEIYKEDGQYYLNYHDRWGNEDDIETNYDDDLVDACYKMILNLHELKLL